MRIFFENGHIAQTFIFSFFFFQWNRRSLQFFYKIGNASNICFSTLAFSPTLWHALCHFLVISIAIWAVFCFFCGECLQLFDGPVSIFFIRCGVIFTWRMNRQFVDRLPPTGPPHEWLTIFCGSAFNIHQWSKRSINWTDLVIGSWRVRMWLVVFPVVSERTVVCPVAKILPQLKKMCIGSSSLAR